MLFDRWSACLFLWIICTVQNFAGGVRVKVKDEVGRVFKSPSPSLPSRLSVEVPDLEGDHVQLALHRNEDQEGTVPVFQLTTNGQGQIELVQIPTKSTLTLYQDPTNMATFGILRNSKTGIAEKLKGIIHRDRKVYELTSSDDVTLDANDITKSLDDAGVAFDMKVHHQLHDKTGYRHDDIVRHTAFSHVASSIMGDHSREARAVTQDVYVEVVALADYAVYSRWYNASNETTAAAKKQDALDNIYQYYAFVFSGVDMMYKNINNSLPYTIHVTLTSVVVCMTAKEAPWTEQHRVLESGEYVVSSFDALTALRPWVAATHSLPPFDHLMLFTGYDLIGEGNTTEAKHSHAGRAYLGTMCNATEGWATSIIEDLGGLQCLDASVHELGHGLGSEHDGENNPCNSADAYIMSTGHYNLSETNKLHRWRFTNCSINYINDFLTETVRTAHGRQCLYHKLNTHGDVVDVTSQVAGQVYPIDEQCREVLGPKSYFCRGTNETASPVDHWDDVCNMVYCYNPITDLCHALSYGAAEGTTCGHKRWCVRGDCVYDDAAPEVPDNCPFGDRPGVDDFGETCAEMALQKPTRCYRHYGATVCCSSCAKVVQPGVVAGQQYNADTQCRHAYGPQSYACRTNSDTILANNTVDCNSLRCYNATDDSCYAEFAAVGTTCAHQKWCVENVLTGVMECVHNESAPAVTDGCPLGDQSGIVLQGHTCIELASHDPILCYNEWVRKTCCSFCHPIYQPGKVPGQLYDVDAQCRMKHGPTSYMCRGFDEVFLHDGTFNCSLLYCLDKDGLCSNELAAMGTTCGDRKWCTEAVNGEDQRCVNNTTAPAVTDGCIFGDRPGVVPGLGVTCEQYVDQQPSRCQGTWTKSNCCSSCAKHHTF